MRLIVLNRGSANRVRAALASALLIFATLLLVTSVARAATPAVADGEDPTVQADAAAWYAANYHLPVATAMQRLAVQDAGNAVLGHVSDALGSSYAGAWFDPSDGGRLKIGVAGSLATEGVQAAQGALGSVAADTDFVPVRSSLGVLQAAQAALNDRLAGQFRAGLVTTSIDIEGNALEIDTASGLPTDAQASVSSAVAASAVPVKVVPTDQPSLSATTSACGFPSAYLMCDPPLRGGAGIVAANNTLCSEGLLVFSNADNAPYILTAGHCAYEAAGTKWSAWFSTGASHQVGYTHSYTFDGTGDYALVGIENPTGWQVSGSRYVWVGPSAAGITTQNSFYTISGIGYPATNSVLCASGTVSPNGYYTNCGTVDGGYHSANECDNKGHCVRVNNLFYAHYAVAQGDSGGPVYKDNVLFGTTNAFDASGVYFEPSPTEFSGSNVY